MDDLIEAFTIFRKYTDAKRPTNCEHDILYVQCDPAIVSAKDKKRLKALGFEPGDGEEPDEVFYSYHFGSC